MRHRLAAVLVLLVAVAGCSSAPTPSAREPLDDTTVPVPTTAPRPRIETVAVVGDSITAGAEEEVLAALTGVGATVVALDAEPGRRTTVDHSVDSGIAAVRRVREREPDLYVIALGTNDVSGLDDGDRAAAMVDELLRELPPDAPLVWVDVFVEGQDEASKLFNDVVRWHLAERGQATVAGWNELVAGSDLLSDGVHPTDAGDVAFAGVIARAVADWRA